MPVLQLAFDPNKVTPGILGFVVVLVIGLALWGLLKSMNKQMRKVSFEEPPGTAKRAPRPGLQAHRAKQREAAESAAKGAEG